MKTPLAAAPWGGVRSPLREGKNSGACACRACAIAATAADNRASSRCPVRRVTQPNALAALSITDIWCQRCGRAWANACTARPVAGAKASVTRNTTPEVPSDTRPWPAMRAPTPTALAALSPAPEASPTAFCMTAGTPVASPQRRAMSARSTPVGALPSASAVICDRFRPQACSMAWLHARAPTSSYSVPEASDRSLTASPVSCRRSQSLGGSTRRICAKTAGSCVRSHSSLGAVKPGIARLPVICRAAGSICSSAAHSALARPSFHRRAGRSTWPCASSTTAPCIWPDRPMPRNWRHAAGAWARSCATALSTAAIQSAGCCSLQVGCGRCCGTAASAVASTCCCSSSSKSLTPEVPRSIPRYMVLPVICRGARSGCAPPAWDAAPPVWGLAAGAPGRGAVSFHPEAACALLAVFAGRHALDVQETAIEIGHVVEPHVVGDAGDVVVRLHQQLAGAVHAHQVHEVGEAVAGGAAKKAREAALGHAQFLRQVRRRERFGQVVGDAADDGVDLVELGVVVLALQLRAR